VPDDYILHEVLHIALVALASLRRKSQARNDAEEDFIWDICSIWKERR
jgi:hypothetical protein